MSVRFPSIAGMFYPAEPAALKSSLEYVREFDSEEKYFAIIVPHAGHAYSGKTAGEVYKKLDKNYEKVIILAPNHSVYTKKAVFDENDEWMTPIGKTPIWKIKTENEAFTTNKIVHKQEHSIEVHLPFLQTKLKKFKLLPIIIGDINEVDLNKISKEIMKYLDNKTLLIISTDLSHFLTERDAREVDNETINKILNLKDVTPEDACGSNPLKVANRIFKELGKKPELVEYSTSAKTTRDTNNVVGYASFIVK